jgi:hypothetical protein
MTLEVCPSCGIQDSIFLSHGPSVGLDGTLHGGRTEAVCNNVSCDQRYWYYPTSNRITRRNTGMGYKDFLLRHVAVDAVNALRRDLGLAPVVEVPSEIDRETAQAAIAFAVFEAVAVGAGPPFPRFPRTKRWLAHQGVRIGRWLADWRAWIAAYWRVYRPFRRTSDE